jgi:hypothetical protein
MQRGDRDTLERLVDFPRVRESLKADLTAAMIKEMRDDPEMQDNMFAELGLAMAPTLVAGVVDAMVNPATLAQLASAKSIDDASSATKTASPVPGVPGAPAAPDAAAPQPASQAPPEFSYSYAGLNRFHAQSKDGPAFLLDRQGLLSWRVVRIEFPDTFLKDK